MTSSTYDYVLFYDGNSLSIQSKQYKLIQININVEIIVTPGTTRSVPKLIQPPRTRTPS